MTTVLVDFHHHDLWESLELLCARLGWDLYRPIGLEWFTEGYWNFERAFHGDRVARQYLEPWATDHDGLRDDASHPGRYHKLKTLAEARDLRPDIVIASVAHNHEGLHRFAQEVGATFGIQLGNVRFSEIDMAEDRWDLASFGLVSTLLPVQPPKPHVVYHQEFSLTDFRHEAPVEHDRLVVSSFVNCFAENTRGYAHFREVAHLASEIDWRAYGSYGSCPRDEYAALDLNRCAEVGDHMRASDIAWHTKQWSDGFGHVVHNWAAVGRPLIGYQSYYQTQLGGPLWVEGVTSYDITDRSADETRALVRSLDYDKRRQMSEAMAARFRDVVNYDEEEQAIRGLFAQVLP